MWARIHKVDRVKPQQNGSAIVLVEDERNTAQMANVQGLSITIAVARVLNAKRALDLKFNGKGEIRYCSSAALPDFLMDAVTRAGAAAYDFAGDKQRVPAQPASVSAVIDQAFAQLAYYLRSSVGAADLPGALKVVEMRRKKAILDKDENPAVYWTAVFELMALAGEQARARNGRWVDTKDMPVPFALKFPEGALAHPSKLAIQIIEGTAEESLTVSDDGSPVTPKPAPAPAPEPVIPSDDPLAESPAADVDPLGDTMFGADALDPEKPAG